VITLVITSMFDPRSAYERGIAAPTQHADHRSVNAQLLPELRSYGRTDPSLRAAFSANKRVIADVAIFAVRGRRQCSDARRRKGEMAFSMTGGRSGSRIGFPCDVPLGYVVLASHGRRCEHGSNDQSRRQELDYGH
jgi:hypothetical protein